MVLATFNLPEEIRERLKLESNQSELVTRLLLNYFQDLNVEKLQEQINLLESQKELQKNTLNMRIEELQKNLEEKKKKEEAEAEAAKKKDLIKKAQEEAITEI